MITQLSTQSKIFEAVYRANEQIDREYKDALDWITDIIINQYRSKLNECEICGSNNKLELHHVRGRKHGNECITVCYECHRSLSSKQKLWPQEWLHDNSDYTESFLIRGLIDVYELKYRKTGQEIYGKIAEILTEEFTYE